MFWWRRQPVQRPCGRGAAGGCAWGRGPGVGRSCILRGWELCAGPTGHGWDSGLFYECEEALEGSQSGVTCSDFCAKCPCAARGPGAVGSTRGKWGSQAAWGRSWLRPGILVPSEGRIGRSSRWVGSGGERERGGVTLGCGQAGTQPTHSPPVGLVQGAGGITVPEGHRQSLCCC